MNVRDHLRVSFVLLLCVFLRRMCFTVSLAGRGNPLDSILWALQKRSSNTYLGSSQKHPSIDHFRMFSCRDREDQLYPDLGSGCHNYFRCLAGTTYSYKCSDGTLFDLRSRGCQPEDDVECPTVPPSTDRCWHQPDGFYPDYDNECASYYSCSNFSVVDEGSCEGNSIWDSATGSCGLGQHVVCSPPSCLGLKEGFYPLQGSACTAYYSCSEGYRTDMLCPFGSIFDYMKKQCVSGPEAVCYERSCEGRVNGLHSAPHATCSTYYRCFTGAMLQLEECSSGQIFNGRKCVQRTNYSCWREGEGSCGNKLDGTYASEDNDCRGFFFCKDQQMIRSFRCDEGLAFNGEKCVGARNFVCKPKPPIPDCTQKFDGYYTVEKTECKTFFRCRRGKKMSEHTCPGNHVFNGHHCVSPLFYSCSANGIERALPNNGVYYDHSQY